MKPYPRRRLPVCLLTGSAIVSGRQQHTKWRHWRNSDGSTRWRKYRSVTNYKSKPQTTRLSTSRDDVGVQGSQTENRSATDKHVCGQKYFTSCKGDIVQVKRLPTRLLTVRDRCWLMVKLRYTITGLDLHIDELLQSDDK